MITEVRLTLQIATRNRYTDSSFLQCGGAMMTAKCPECDEPIGGGSHTLLASNTRNTEFEEILRQRGVGQGY